MVAVEVRILIVVAVVVVGIHVVIVNWLDTLTYTRRVRSISLSPAMSHESLQLDLCVILVACLSVCVCVLYNSVVFFFLL